jgi:hypothetical protein
LRYFFSLAIAVKLNTCNHSQNPYTNTTFSLPTFGKNHYPLAVIFICTYLRYFSTLRRGAMSSPTISRKQDHLAGARINEVVLVTCTCGKLLLKRYSLAAVFSLTFHLLKNGGGWRWLAEITLFKVGTAFLEVLLNHKNIIHQRFHSKNLRQNLHQKCSLQPFPTPKKWRWLAVVGGNHVFSAFLKLLKSAVPICVVFVGVLFPRTTLHSPRFVSPQNGNKQNSRLYSQTIASIHL